MKSSKNKALWILSTLLLYSVMFFYLLLLFLLLFKKAAVGTKESVNLVPFETIGRYLSKNTLAHSFAVNNLLGNILIFIPFGVYITLFNRHKKIYINTCIIMLVSVLVEVLQYLFGVGIMDIDDVILNTIGGFIGIIIYKGFNLIFKENTRNAIAFLAPIGGIITFILLMLMNR